MPHPPHTPEIVSPKRRSRSLWLLVLPYVALLFPGIYARSTPALFGIPFFYWYQFAWVVIASAIMGFVYIRIKERETPPWKAKARHIWRAQRNSRNQS